MIRFAGLALAALTLLAGAARADDWFTDDFGDGIIDRVHWTAGGAVTEHDGMLDLLRQEPGDYIQTVSTYSGDWVLELDSRLNYVVWNDMFHGISVLDGSGLGISFGYSMYGKLYLAVHDGHGGTGFYYGPAGSNQPGRWQHWVLTKQGSQITVQVDGVQPIPVAGPAGENAQISMPGFYEDGDGGPHVGYTSSSVDIFSIRPASSGVEDEQPRLEIGSWGRVKGLFAR